MSASARTGNVVIAGTAMSRFGRQPDLSVPELGSPVVMAALADAGIDRQAIQAVYCGSAFSGRLVGQRVLGPLGMLGVPVVNVENACSSGGTAFQEAVHAVQAERFDIALVIGIDKLSALGGGVLPGQAEDWEVAVGLTMPALYAMRASRYLHEHGLEPRHLAEVTVKARRHAAQNPDAQIRKPITVEEVQAARMVAEPFTLLHCCPTADGAAAAVVMSRSAAIRLGVARPVRILGTELTSGRFLGGFRDMTTPEITARGARALYEATGVGPQDVDVAEVHDAFTIAELLYYEAFGFCARGEALSLLRSGATSIGGRIPVNPSGGLLCKGHPVGATGVAQIVEVARQLQGRCGERQVGSPRIGLTHCTGGGIAGLDHAACTINLLAA